MQMQPMVDNWGKSDVEWLPVSSQAYSANKFSLFLMNMESSGWFNVSLGTSILKSQNLPLEVYTDDGVSEDKQYLTIAPMEDDDE